VAFAHFPGATADDVAETYRHAAAVGLVGATIEDLTPTRRKDKPLFDIGEATERVAAAVAATHKLGFPFMLTARAEGFRTNTDLDDAIKRLQVYEKAGADVLAAPGLPDLASVKAVCAAIAKPFNFMAGIPASRPRLPGWKAAGVRRISLAGSLYGAAMGGLVAAAHELKDKGTFGYVDNGSTAAGGARRIHAGVIQTQTQREARFEKLAIDIGFNKGLRRGFLIGPPPDQRWPKVHDTQSFCSHSHHLLRAGNTRSTSESVAMLSSATAAPFKNGAPRPRLKRPEILRFRARPRRDKSPRGSNFVRRAIRSTTGEYGRLREADGVGRRIVPA
jgi:Phosphoenolpyruvate phosphomutase